MPAVLTIAAAVRERRLNWRVTASFSVVVGSALAFVITCFSVAWPILGESLPFPNASRVAAVRSSLKGVAGGLSWGDADDLRKLVPSLDKLAIYSARTWGVQTERQGHVEVLLSVMATGDFFEVLGEHPAIGEPMTRAHDESGSQSAVWLTSAAAARLFGRADAALHRTIWINAEPRRVAGVLPESFRFPMPEGEPDVILPLSRTDYCCMRGRGAQHAVGLLRDREKLAAELQVASSVLAAEYPATNAGLQFVSLGFREHLFGPRLRAVRWILAGALCLLLIAAANGSGIWLAQWLRLRRDIAIRLSLGASPGRLAAMRSVEGAIAGLLAASIGVCLSALLLTIIRATPLLSDRLQAFAVWRPPSLEPVAVIGAVLAGITTGIAAALLPHMALMVRVVREGMRDSLSSHPVAWRVRLVLTSVQLGATATLAWTALALGENIHALLNAERGFTTEHTLIAGIGIPEARYNTDESMIGFHTSVVEQLRAVPGVTAAAGGINVPQGGMRTRFLRDGEVLQRNRQPLARVGVATPELLPLLGMSLRRGRGFTANDRWGAPRVALVNETFVRTYLANAADPLREGVRPSFFNGFAMKPYTRFQIVGIVADTRNDATLPGLQPQIILPATQVAMEGFFYYVKTTRPHAGVTTELRQAIWRVDPAIQRATFRPLREYLERGLADRRALSAFGLLILAVAGVIVGAGLFASLSASLLESAKELAIRSALGATPARLALESLRWVFAAAVIAGIATALAAPAIARNIELDNAVLRPTPTSVMLCLLAMVVVAGSSAFLPVRRAACTRPAHTLRTE